MTKDSQPPQQEQSEKAQEPKPMREETKQFASSPIGAAEQECPVGGAICGPDNPMPVRMVKRRKKRAARGAAG